MNSSSNFAIHNTQSTRWVMDVEVSNCQMCGVQFDTFKRKHHCRKCGGIFCSNCAAHRRLMPAGSTISVGGISAKLNERNPQRVCRTCQAELDPLQSRLANSVANAVKQNKAEKTGMASQAAAFIEGFTLGAEIRKAAYTVKNFSAGGPISDRAIPTGIVEQAKGLVFLHVIKGGFMISGRIGSGLIIAKMSDGGWSAPSAIVTVGVGWGAQVGAEASNYVLVLTTASALKAFSGRGQVSLGAEVGIAAGPLGRTATVQGVVGTKGLAPCYSYSHSKGIFAGVSLEGSVIAMRPDVNKNFYGVNIKPEQLFSNPVHRPIAARPLYEALAEMRNSVFVEPTFQNASDGQFTPNMLELNPASPLGRALQESEYEDGGEGLSALTLAAPAWAGSSGVPQLSTPPDDPSPLMKAAAFGAPAPPPPPPPPMAAAFTGAAPAWYTPAAGAPAPAPVFAPAPAPAPVLPPANSAPEQPAPAQLSASQPTVIGETVAI